MSTIGVGKAFRAQDREGRRARARAVDKQFLTLGSPAFLILWIERIRQDWRRPELESSERAELIAGHVWLGAAYLIAMAGVMQGLSTMSRF